MPDVHSGKGVTIGFTQMINKENPRINPNMVGVDIGCGMLVLKISKEAGDKLQLPFLIRMASCKKRLLQKGKRQRSLTKTFMRSSQNMELKNVR